VTRYCAREFTAHELDIIRALIAHRPAHSRARLSQLTCQALHWYKPDGELKQMSCRVAMLRMHADGLIELPPPRGQRPQCRIRFTPKTDPQAPLEQPVHSLGELTLEPVRRGPASQLWNEYIERYHYLGYNSLPGAQLRYFVTGASRTLALLGFGASAWLCAPRERFIGWSDAQRQNHLHLVVNNARFLILPWVRSQNLASKILALAARRLPQDWQQRYGYRPVLLETFVEQHRFTGTCYHAANWLHVGHTKGRGKLGPAGKQSVPIKDVWLYPLDRRFKRHLTR
jgi:hypothetical protein